MNGRSWGLLGILSAIWGSSYLLIALGVADLGPAALVFLRVGIAAVVLTPLALRHRRTLKGHLRALPLVALAQVALPFMLIGTAEQRIPSGLAGVLVASQPLWLVILAPLLRTGRPGMLSIVGTVLGFGGVALVVGVDGGGTVEPVSVLMVLGAALSYAVGAWLARRTMDGVQSTTQTWATMLVASLMVAPVAAFQVPAHVGMQALVAVTILGVVGTAGAFGIFVKLIKDAGPAHASLVSYLAPGFALGYGAAILHEHVGVGAIGGLLLILGGSWLSTRTSLPRLRRRAAAPSEEPGALAPECSDARA